MSLVRRLVARHQSHQVSGFAYFLMPGYRGVYFSVLGSRVFNYFLMLGIKGAFIFDARYQGFPFNAIYQGWFICMPGIRGVYIFYKYLGCFSSSARYQGC